MERRVSALRDLGAPRRAIATRIWRLAVPIIVAAGLCGCASISEKFRDTAAALPGVGLPADAPQRTAQPVAFPAVHDIPPPRNSVTLTNTEQSQLERELVAARDEQQTISGVPLQPKKQDPKAKRPGGKIVPVSSQSSIY
jgi:hypothetical protein